MPEVTSLIDTYRLLLILWLVALISAFFLTPIVGYLARRFGLVDLPSHLREKTDTTRGRRIHKDIIPRAGGAAVIIPLVILSIFTVGVSSKAIVGLMIGTTLIFVVGLIDDRYQISGKVQFLFQVIAALIVVVSGTSIELINVPFDGTINLVWAHISLFGDYGLSLPADLMTAFWIVLVINAVNWVNGSDGLVEGISIVTASALMFISIEAGNLGVAILSAIFAGAMMGFIPFNLYPAKIFSGAGAPTYGFILGTLSIFSGAKMSVAILLLSVPILDMIWVLLNRIRTHRTVNPMKLMTISDKTHLHHRLLSRGYSAKEVAMIELAIVSVVSTIALFAGNLEKLGIIAVIVTLLIVGFIIIRIFGLKERDFRLRRGLPPSKPPKKGDTPESKYAY